MNPPADGGVDESRLIKLGYNTQYYAYTTPPEKTSQKYPQDTHSRWRVPLTLYPLRYYSDTTPKTRYSVAFTLRVFCGGADRENNYTLCRLDAVIAKLVEACENDKRWIALALNNPVTKPRQLSARPSDTHVTGDRVGRHGLVTQTARYRSPCPNKVIYTWARPRDAGKNKSKSPRNPQPAHNKPFHQLDYFFVTGWDFLLLIDTPSSGATCR
eukprot:4760209-Pleurochrysis_carterae.AAC.2